VLAACERDDPVGVGAPHQIVRLGQRALVALKKGACLAECWRYKLGGLVVRLQKATHLAGVDQAVGTFPVNGADLAQVLGKEPETKAGTASNIEDVIEGGQACLSP